MDFNQDFHCVAFVSGLTEPSRCKVNDDVKSEEKKEVKSVNCRIYLFTVKSDADALSLRLCGCLLRNCFQFPKVSINL